MMIRTLLTKEEVVCALLQAALMAFLS